MSYIKSPEERVAAIRAVAVGSDLSSWEKFEFLPSIRTRDTLTDKQERVLRGIEQRIAEQHEEDAE